MLIVVLLCETTSWIKMRSTFVFDCCQGQKLIVHGREDVVSVYLVDGHLSPDQHLTYLFQYFLNCTSIVV